MSVKYGIVHYSQIAFDKRVLFWLQRAQLLPCVCMCLLQSTSMHVQLHNGYMQTCVQIMQHTHMHKAVTWRVEAKELPSCRRQSDCIISVTIPRVRKKSRSRFFLYPYIRYRVREKSRSCFFSTPNHTWTKQLLVAFMICTCTFYKRTVHTYSMLLLWGSHRL